MRSSLTLPNFISWFKVGLKAVIVLFGVILLALYLYFRVQFINMMPVLAVFSVIVFIAELHTIFHVFGMFYSIWPRKYPIYDFLNRSKNLQIYMFICVCGEPAEIVRQTVMAAECAAERYTEIIGPDEKPKVVVLNDGFVAKKDNWEDIANLCKDLKVGHIMRKTPGGFKAGNINHALSCFPTNDRHNTIDIIFDSDFCAKKDFLMEITKPFMDSKTDFVQSPQRYKNEKTWIAKAAAAHQIFFFDHVCPAKGYDNSLFLCGTNFAIRRSALEDIGGVDERFITEDYATSLNLHMAGKKGVFMPKVLALGIAPSSLKAYFSQQQRWSKGNFDVTGAYLKQLFLGPLTFKQKFHYLLSATYYLIGLRDFILMLAPLPYLLFGVSLIKPNTMAFLALIYTPLLIYNFMLYTKLFKHPLKSLVLDIISFPVFTAAFLSSLVKKNLGFIVTIKKYEKENPFSVYRLQLFVATVLIAGLIVSFKVRASTGFGAFINHFWATFDAFFLVLGFLLIVRENYALKLTNRIIAPIKVLWRPGYSGSPFSQKMLLRPIFAILALVLVMPILMTNLPEFQILAFMGVKDYALRPNIRQELLAPENGVYYGYYQPSLNKHPQKFSIGLVKGEKPSLVMFYQDWGSGKGFDTRFMEAITKLNVISVVTWEPWDSTANKESVDQDDYSPKIIAEGKYDDYIRKWAKGAAAFKKPIFLRFAHEMNGNWYGWGNVNGNTPDDYKKMWIHVHDIFKEEKATNITWVWSPNNTNEDGNSDSMMDYYPGSEYVDWVGFSGFNWGSSTSYSSWITFRNLAYNAYEILSKLNKPIMVTETSSASLGGDKLSWFAQTLEEDIPALPNIKAVVLFNQDFKGADFSLSENENVSSTISNIVSDNGYYIKDPRFLIVS